MRVGLELAQVIAAVLRLGLEAVVVKVGRWSEALAHRRGPAELRFCGG